MSSSMQPSSSLSSRARRLAQLTLRFLLLGLTLAAFGAGAQSVGAQSDVFFRIGNDLWAGNTIDDDVYTSGLGLTLEFDQSRDGAEGQDRRFVTFEENTFTDSEANVRFDETWLLFGRRVATRRWNSSFYLGAVRAGRGLFGEDLQNSVHRLIGDNEVLLDYVDRDRDFGVAGIDARRLLHSGRVSIEAVGNLRVAVGFQQWLAAAVSGTWRINPWLTASASLGARVSRSQYAVLDPWIEEFAPTVELGVILRDRWIVSWTSNEYGTDMGHLNLQFRLPTRLRLGGPTGPEN